LPNKIHKLFKGFIEEFKPVTGPECKSKSRQLIEVTQLILRCQFTPDEYYYFRFYEKNKDYRYMLNFLSNFNSLEYYHPPLRDLQWIHLLRNKLLFNIYYRSFNLPVTKVYGYFDRRAGFSTEGAQLSEPEQLLEFLLEHKPPSLVIKPVGGRKGKDILIIDQIEYGRQEILTIASGLKTLSFNDLLKHLSKTAPGNLYSGYLLEEKLTQHDLLNKINPSCVNTLRIVTFLNKEHHASVRLAGLRLGRVGSAVDNTARGGLLVSINLEDGTLGEGVFYTKKYGYRTRYSRHPDTNTIFKGLKVPFWEEILKLCCNAAKVSPFCRSIGWDVAITPNGPVFIEGNSLWALTLQVHSSGYLQPDMRKYLKDYGLVFAENKLPGINVRALFKALKRWSNR
jgi:hypothetical protein